jgi:hypothetical protein
MAGWLANELGPRRAVCIEGIIGVLATALFVLYKRRQAAGESVEGKAVFVK